MTYHDPFKFRGNSLSVGWDLLWSTCTPYLKSLHSPTMKIWRAMQNVEIGLVWEVRGHPRSLAMLLFDTAHMTYYSTVIETIHLPCIVLESPMLTHPPAFGTPVGVNLVEFCQHLWRQENWSPWAIVWQCLRDSTFSHFDTIPTCDRWMDRHKSMANTVLA